MYVYLYYLPLESTYNFCSISQHINKQYTVRYNKFKTSVQLRLVIFFLQFNDSAVDGVTSYTIQF